MEGSFYLATGAAAAAAAAASGTVGREAALVYAALLGELKTTA